MLLKCKCPKCGEGKEYLAEQVGTPLDCFRCGHRFLLQNNPVRVTWHILTATLAVLVIIGGIFARVYLRAERWGAFDHHSPAVSFQFGDHDDDDDDR